MKSISIIMSMLMFSVCESSIANQNQSYPEETSVISEVMDIMAMPKVSKQELLLSLFPPSNDNGKRKITVVSKCTGWVEELMPDGSIKKTGSCD